MMDFAAMRDRMVREQLAAPGRDISNERVLGAMLSVPRHEFVPVEIVADAYADMALPIGEGQTISQPFVVARMTELVDPRREDRVLEVGGGCGYQAAVLGELTGTVVSLEIVEGLARKADETIKRLGYLNVEMLHGDGHAGLVEMAPFDVILVACAAATVPGALVDQLAEGGRMIMPVGPRARQELRLIKKRHGRIEESAVLPVRFVPMTGGSISGDTSATTMGG